MSKKQTVLVTNDDGIESRFLHAIAESVAKDFEVFVVAPEFEQSWIGRAMSRRKALRVRKYEDLPYPAWTVDGSPTDCVNIALGNLMPSAPVAVISGINIGYNTTNPLIFSSGTIAGAAEGAFWNVHSIAVSQAIPDGLFEDVTSSKGELPEKMKNILHQSAEHAAQFLKKLIKTNTPVEPIVHNLNYPSVLDSNLELVQTEPAQLEKLSFYEETEPGIYNFRFSHGSHRESDKPTDRDVIAKGKASHTILNFSHLGRL